MLQAIRTDEPGALSDLLSLVLRQSRRLAGDYATLAVLDARSAAIRLAVLLSAALVAAVLIVTAWLACVVALTVWLLGAGSSWPAALGAAALLNLLAAALLILWVRGPVWEPPFAATLRQLRGEPPSEAEHRP